MRAPLILGKIDRDLACAIALGFVQWPQVVTNLQKLTLCDERMQTVGSDANWLDGDDPLDAIAREYLAAKQEAMKSSTAKPAYGHAWSASSASKTRDEANKRAIAARAQGARLLAERGTLAAARKQGLHVIDAAG